MQYEHQHDGFAVDLPRQSHRQLQVMIPDTVPASQSACKLRDKQNNAPVEHQWLAAGKEYKTNAPSCLFPFVEVKEGIQTLGFGGWGAGITFKLFSLYLAICA